MYSACSDSTAAACAASPPLSAPSSRRRWYWARGPGLEGGDDGDGDGDGEGDGDGDGECNGDDEKSDRCAALRVCCGLRGRASREREGAACAAARWSACVAFRERSVIISAMLGGDIL